MDDITAALEGAQIEFPVTFDLRVIYVLDQGGTIQEDLEAIYARLEVPCSLMQGVGS